MSSTTVTPELKTISLRVGQANAGKWASVQKQSECQSNYTSYSQSNLLYAMQIEVLTECQNNTG